MAPITYSGFEFYYLWRSVSLESLTNYSIRFNDFFKNDRRGGFSSEEFVRSFQPHLKHYNPHSNLPYRFEVEGVDYNETWQMKLRLTQISHLEGGILCSSPHSPSRGLAFGYDLIQHELASVVSISRFVKAKGIRRLLGKTISGTLVGATVHIYLWQRLLGIPTLRKKLRWEALSANGFDFSVFADRMANVLEPNQSEIIELCSEPRLHLST